MEPIAMLERLEKIGIQITIAGDKLQFRPGSAVPPELIPEIKEHKQELVALLKLKRYNFKYSDPQATDQELEEIAARVEVEGYILLWSTVLCAPMAFYRDEESRSKIPPGFVPYSEAELRELFGGGNAGPSPESLRLIHEAKKHGGYVTSQGGDTRRLPTDEPLVVWEGTVDEYRSLLMLREAELVVAKTQLTVDEYIDPRIQDRILNLEIQIRDLRKWLAEATQKENGQWE